VPKQLRGGSKIKKQCPGGRGEKKWQRRETPIKSAGKKQSLQMVYHAQEKFKAVQIWG
jgi:hypothetical protein